MIQTNPASPSPRSSLNLGSNGQVDTASRSTCVLTSLGANTQQAEEGPPEAGAEHEEADEVDGAAEQGQCEGRAPHNQIEVLVLLTLVVAQTGVLEDVVEGVGQGQDHVGHGGGQDGHRHLPLPLSPRLLVGRGLHALRLHVVTPQGPHGGHVDGHQGQERDVGHEDWGRRSEAVCDVRVGFVAVRVLDYVHLLTCPRAQHLHIDKS